MNGNAMEPKMPQVDSTAALTSAPGHDAATARNSPVIVGVAACAAVFLCVASFHYGRDARINAASAEAAAVEQETRDFCLGLGLAPGADLYRRCESGLAAIRERQEQRLAAEAAGLI